MSTDKDTERLEAYELQCPCGFDWTVSPLDDGGWTVHPWRIGTAWAKEYPYPFWHHFQTLREAIDAARENRHASTPESEPEANK